MKKATIQFTGVYPSFNVETKVTRILFNYVVISGDVDTYAKDKEATNHLSIQDDINTPEFNGKPRFVSTKNLGMTTEIDRVVKKDGTIDWYTDNIEQMIINAEVDSLPEYAKVAYGKELALEAIIRAKSTALAIKAQRAKAQAVNADLTKK